VILTLDFGTSVTKVAVWGPDGLVASAGTPVATTHPSPGWSEQQPSDWWGALTEATARVQALAPAAFGSVDVVGCTGARQSFALVDAVGDPLGPAILWSDRRAAFGLERTGHPGPPAGRPPPRSTPPSSPPASPPSTPSPDTGSVAATIAWLAAHDRDRMDASAWVLAPRDLVAWWLTGTVATDVTMASRSGLYDEQGRPDEALAGLAASKLAPVLPSDRVAGGLLGPSAEALGLMAGTPVVIGAGDRPCEVLGTGAAESRPMASWGTTANVSVPVGVRPHEVLSGLVVSRSATGGWLIEGGLSGAGSLLAWVGGLTGRAPEELAALAATSPPGARGVAVAPWLDGARAPWWRPGAKGALVGLSSSHGLADVARAVFEAVAWEMHRCLEAMACRRPAGPAASGLVLGGAGASIDVWAEILTGITGLPATGRRSGQAASAGAALLAARAVGMAWDLDAIDPVDRRITADPTVVGHYRGYREAADRVAAAVLGLTGPGGGGPGGESGVRRDDGEVRSGGAACG
jgi:xylulokinase